MLPVRRRQRNRGRSSWLSALEELPRTHRYHSGRVRPASGSRFSRNNPKLVPNGNNHDHPRDPNSHLNTPKDQRFPAFPRPQPLPSVLLSNRPGRAGQRSGSAGRATPNPVPAVHATAATARRGWTVSPRGRLDATGREDLYAEKGGGQDESGDRYG